MTELAHYIIEKHVLNRFDDIEVSVEIWSSGDVDVNIGEANISATTLGEIVAFVEQHGQITVRGPE